jgi:hypothetical protein
MSVRVSAVHAASTANQSKSSPYEVLRICSEREYGIEAKPRLIVGVRGLGVSCMRVS